MGENIWGGPSGGPVPDLGAGQHMGLQPQSRKTKSGQPPANLTDGFEKSILRGFVPSNFIENQERLMKRTAVFVVCALLASSSLYAEALDKNKFVAPGSDKTSLKAPVNDALKNPGVTNPAQGSTSLSGVKTPIPASGGSCPEGYYCNVANPASPKCYPDVAPGAPYSGTCAGVSRFCADYLRIKNSGGVVDDSDDAKYARYCK